MPITQPDLNQYELKELWLYPRWTRAEYSKTFGKQPSAFKVKEQIKRWYVPASLLPTGGTYQYEFFNEATAVYETYSVSRSVAALMNLPGLYDYVKYEILPTLSVWVSDVNNGQTVESVIPAEYLSTEAQANDMLKELGGTGKPFQQEMVGVRAKYDTTDPRKVWYITFANGDIQNVGNLLKTKYSQGVDAPGHWSNPGSNPVWISEGIQPEINALPEIPIPARKLYSNEQLVSVLFGGLLIQRTDKGLFQSNEDRDKMPRRIGEIWDKIVAGKK